MTTTNDRAHETKAKLEGALRGVVETVREQSQIWARFGLTTGKAALETNAKALASAAEMLGKLAASLAPGDPASTAEAPRDPEA